MLSAGKEGPQLRAIVFFRRRKKYWRKDGRENAGGAKAVDWTSRELVTEGRERLRELGEGGRKMTKMKRAMWGVFWIAGQKKQTVDADLFLLYHDFRWHPTVEFLRFEFL